jgi:hypothetical protein
MDQELKIDKSNITQLLQMCTSSQSYATRTGDMYRLGHSIFLEHVRRSSKNVWINEGISKLILPEDRKDVEEKVIEFFHGDVRNVYFDLSLGYVDVADVKEILKNI